MAAHVIDEKDAPILAAMINSCLTRYLRTKPTKQTTKTR